MQDASSNRAANPLVSGKCPACRLPLLFLGEGGYVTCGYIECPEPDAASKLLEHDGRAIPNRVVCRVCGNEPHKSQADGMYHCDTCNRKVIPVPADATPKSVSITVSEETADWITAKAIEHGCTEDEVIATLIADWNEAVDG